LLAASFNLNLQARYDEALSAGREALEYARNSGDRRLIGNALVREAMAVYGTDVAQGRKLYDEALAIFAACDDPDGSCLTLLNRAEHEFNGGRGDVYEALRLLHAALPIAQKLKGRNRIVLALANAAAYHVALGQFDEARTSARESLTLLREAQAPSLVAAAIEHLAAVALHNGDARTAARLLGWSDAYMKAIDEARQTTEQREYEELVAALQIALGPEQLQTLLAEGAMMTEDATYEEALRV
jgi:tetratricopeptide (TPR) repeat protein